MGDAPVQVHEGYAIAGKRYESASIGGLILWFVPTKKGSGKENLVGAVAGTGIAGMRETDRLGLFTSGVAYPDWTLFDPSAKGQILADGFYSSDWTLDLTNSAFAR